MAPKNKVPSKTLGLRFLKMKGNAFITLTLVALCFFAFIFNIKSF